MKTKHIFWGLLFIILGSLILINNFTSLNFGWETLWKFWPLVFIIWGVSLIVKSDLVKNMLAAVAAIVFALTIFASVKSTFGVFNNIFNIDNNGIHITIDGETETNLLTETFDSTRTKAVLNFKSGAGTFTLNGTTDNLISAFTEVSEKAKYELTRIDTDNQSEISLSLSGKKISISDGKIRNKAEIKLNDTPVWEINFDVGAASTKIDLRPFKVSDLKINIGAASLKLLLGNLETETNVEIDAGASSIEIQVPESSGCEIRTDDALTSKSFNGFNKRDDGVYRSENFDNSQKKIFLQIDSGVSSIKVTRVSEEW